MNWDAGAIYFSDQHLANSGESTALEPLQAQTKFQEFLRDYRENNVFIYRKALVENFNRGEYFVEVDLAHLGTFNNVLLDVLQKEPNSFLPQFEIAAQKVVSDEINVENPPPINVLLKSSQSSVSIRSLNANHVNRLVSISGLIISASRSRPKAIKVAIRCSNCNFLKYIPVPSAFGTIQLPRRCDRPRNENEQECPLDPFVIVSDRSMYVDQQSLKLQETPEEVPTGEIPRHILLSVNRYLVDKVSPGCRVKILGISNVFNGKDNNANGIGIRTPYMNVVGLKLENEGRNRSEINFSSEEENEFLRMSKDEKIYEKLWKSIAPQISGKYTEDMKKAICCLLFGGSRKVLPDGMKLRGDVNVLFLGDPSTAKSQFLKFVERISPIGIYTSGKGSSAAGLTASVIRDNNSGEFYLEGGALVLGDGGVVCIDEFDKMRESDRVSIHEAMEQQTISVAKAGITTILNSRSSILAAANPVYGRYDDSKSSSENIDFLPTILSRFDLIFIVRDIRDEERDKNMAHHIINIHLNNNNNNNNVMMLNNNSNNINNVNENDVSVINNEILKKYINYCKYNCGPRLSEEGMNELKKYYVKIREDVRDRAHEEGSFNPSIPITIRQLEAIIRISESLSKMKLKMTVNVEEVKEAIRLFNDSTMNACRSGLVLMSDNLSDDLKKQIEKAENSINRRLSIGSVVLVDKLIRELENVGLNGYAIRRAIQLLINKGNYINQSQRKTIKRLK